jgi:signal transduction histidine kinase
MRVKIAILLFLCVGLLATLIILYKDAEDKRLGVLFGQETKERTESIHRVFLIAERSLETLAYEYTHWDEMVDFTSTSDKVWARNNIDAALDTYKANGVWIYNTDGVLLYSVDNMSDGLSAKLPFGKSEIRGLFEKTRIRHFFIATPDGPMEIRGATIHKGFDVEKKTPLSGYLLAGRVWNKEYLDNLSELTASKVQIRTEDNKSAELISNAATGVIAFEKVLEDWRGHPVSCVNISCHSDIAGIFTRDSRKMLLILLGYAAVIVVMLYFVLIMLVIVPLDSISTALAKEDTSRIKGLALKEDEFGLIASLIDKFFRQKQSLLTEVSERKRSDEALVAKMGELEEAYKQLQEMQARLVQSEKLAALGRFASGVAHEVKNPLAILLGGLGYIKAKLPGADPELREALTKMKEAVMRADIIVKDLLTFARPSKAAADIVHPNELIRDAVVFIELFKHKSDTADINVRQELTDKDILVEVDKAQMQQALFNILLNAIEAMPMKGDVLVKTYACTAQVPPDPNERSVCVIEIRDTGSGISKEDMAKVFEPFFTTKMEKKGTGLGLSIVKSIIDKNKGAISIQSEINRGTTVRIMLPEAAQPKEGKPL